MICGADIALDNWNLIIYSADRSIHVKYYLIAKSKIASAFDSVKSIFAPRSLAVVAA